MEDGAENDNFEVLLESLRAIEAQRPLLGDAINPLIEEVIEKAKASLVTPDENQIAISESWQQVVDAATNAGIDAPDPTPEIAESIASVESYKQRLSIIGSMGMSQSIEPPREVVKQTVNKGEISPTKDKAPTRASKKKSKDSIQQKETKDTVENIDNKTVVITDGKNTFKPQDSIKKMHVVILRELSQNPEGVITTELVKKLTGGFSSREIQLFKSGTKSCPEGVNPDDLKPIVDQFYTAVKKLREKGFIFHTSSDDEGQKPKIKAVSRMTFSEEKDEFIVAIEPIPYKVTFSLGEQTVDNGRGKQIELIKSPETFASTAIALGSIATREFYRDRKITMEMVGQFIEDDYGKTTSKAEKDKISTLIREIYSALDGNFPIEPRGIKGGAHFVYTGGSEIKVVDTINEKLNFDDPVKLKFSDLMISLEQKDINFDLIDYSKQRDLKGVNDEEIGSLLSSYKSFIEVLSMLSKHDSIEIDDIFKLLGVNKDNANSTIGRFRNLVNKINSAANEKIINWRRQNGVVIDVNRRIIISGEDDEDISSLIDIEPTPQLENTTVKPTPQEQIETEQNQEVPDTLSAKEIVADIEKLDDKIKKNIKGRLIELGRYNYPEKMVEAAYLLHLLTDDSSLAEIRNSGRFNHQDESKYKDFIANAMFVCYLRTRSWGDFGSLLRALSDISPSANTSETRTIVKSFESTTSTMLGLSSERKNYEMLENQRYSERALDSLKEGKIPRPNSHRQAIILLDTFRTNRAEIAKGRNKKYFDELVGRVQSLVAETLGKDNFEIALDSRTSRYSSGEGRAVQVTTGAESALVRTDSNRFPDHRQPKRKRSRRRR
jgi:hypothetical protein